MSFPVELRQNGLHRQQRTPELDDLFIVGRGDQFKLVLGLAFEQSDVSTKARERRKNHPQR